MSTNISLWVLKNFVDYVKTEREEILVKNVEMEAKSEIWHRTSRRLVQLDLPTIWSENPILCFIMASIDQEEYIQRCLDAFITDLWLPIQKPVLKRVLPENGANSFLKQQKECMEEMIPRPFTGEHFCVMDSDHLDFEEVKKLGEGGNGKVWSVKDRQSQKLYARKTIKRPSKFQWQVDYMKNFKREVYGMRRVSHRHCVKLWASLTDMDSMVLISSPVADMDLRAFLNLDLTASQTRDLRHMPGCITSAIAYLHDLQIRHDDLKPNNILINGSNVLLTDFGVCRDASDSGDTTTSGPPEHSVIRYSAPEVFDHSSRNRLTDIWGLGCILFEIVSRLEGHKLEEMRSFWKSIGNCSESYAQNPVATAAWFDRITKGADKSQSGTRRRAHLVASFIYHALLERDIHLRPTATQVLDKLVQIDIVHPDENGYCWVSECCYQDFYNRLQCDQTAQVPSGGALLAHVPLVDRFLPQWPIPDLRFLDKHLAYVFLSPSLKTLACSDNFDGFKNKTTSPPTVTLDYICSSGSIEMLKGVVPTMLAAQGLSTSEAAYPSSEGLTHQDLLQNLYFSSLFKTVSMIGCLHISLVISHRLGSGFDKSSSKPHVFQLSCVRMCLKRHQQAGAPYLVLIFDPTVTVYRNSLVQPRTNVWINGLEPDTNWRRRVKDTQCSFDRVLDMHLKPTKCYTCTALNIECEVSIVDSYRHSCELCITNCWTCVRPFCEFLGSEFTEPTLSRPPTTSMQPRTDFPSYTFTNAFTTDNRGTELNPGSQEVAQPFRIYAPFFGTPQGTPRRVSSTSQLTSEIGRLNMQASYSAGERSAPPSMPRPLQPRNSMTEQRNQEGIVPWPNDGYR